MFKLEFRTDNESFENKEIEIISIMAGIMGLIGNGRTCGIVMDSNGNNIGSWSIED